MYFILLDSSVADAASEVTSAAESGGTMGTLTMVLYIVIIVAALYFLMIRPNKKKQKQEEQMRNNISIGDEIVTIGGIYGRVVSIKDDSLIMESGADRTKQQFAKWAVQTNLTLQAAQEAEKAQKAENKRKEKEEKAKDKE